MNNVEIRPFRPYPFVWGGHTQTMLAALFKSAVGLRATRQHRVTLPDGDQLALHDDAAEDWSPGDPVALLVHGLCGSAESAYMQRTSAKLTARGTRTFRLDLRGCGAGVGLSRLPYHGGQSDDLQATADFIRQLAPDSLIMPVGFSLGGNIVLKWLGEQAAIMPNLVSRAMAINPPLNLEACTDHVRMVAGGFYDRHFARLLFRHVAQTPHWQCNTPLSRTSRRPRRIIEFDELFTAPVAGYDNARQYYRECSAERVLPAINVPTLILSAQDDPLIPRHTLERAQRSEHVSLHIAEGGGHLGYIGASGHDPDRHWMDWRVVDWLLAQTPPALAQPAVADAA
jgi:uncharacterized protein